MTRLNIGLWKPATFDPAYPDGKYYRPLRKISDIKYIVAHDAVGFRSFLVHGSRLSRLPGDSDAYGRGSWIATNCTDGEFWEHFEIEMPTWTNGTKQANYDGYALENESEAEKGPWGFPQAANVPVTDAQVRNIARVYVTLERLGAPLQPPVRGQGFREHRMFSTSTCPNNRFGPNGERWLAVAAEVKRLKGESEEDDMFTDEDRASLTQIKEILGYGHKLFYEGDTKSTDWASAANLPGWFRRHLRAELDAATAKIIAAAGGGASAGAIVALIAERLAG